jgi:hypothetical protein
MRNGINATPDKLFPLFSAARCLSEWLKGAYIKGPHFHNRHGIFDNYTNVHCHVFLVAGHTQTAITAYTDTDSHVKLVPLHLLALNVFLDFLQNFLL